MRITTFAFVGLLFCSLLVLHTQATTRYPHDVHFNDESRGYDPSSPGILSRAGRAVMNVFRRPTAGSRFGCQGGECDQADRAYEDMEQGRREMSYAFHTSEEEEKQAVERGRYYNDQDCDDRYGYPCSGQEKQRSTFEKIKDTLMPGSRDRSSGYERDYRDYDRDSDYIRDRDRDRIHDREYDRDRDWDQRSHHTSSIGSWYDRSQPSSGSSWFGGSKPSSGSSWFGGSKPSSGSSWFGSSRPSSGSSWFGSSNRGPVDYAKDKMSDMGDKASDSYDEARYRSRRAYDNAKDKMKDMGNKAYDKAYDTYDDMRYRSRSAYDDTKDKMRDLANKASDTYDDVAYRTRRNVDKAVDTTADIARRTGDQMRRAYDTAADLTKDAYYRLRDRASDVLSESADKARYATSRMADTARSAARSTAIGATSLAATATHSFADMASHAADALGNVFARGWEGTKDALAGAKDRMGYMMSSNYRDRHGWTIDEQKEANLELQVALKLMDKGKRLMNQVLYEECENNRCPQDVKIRKLREAEHLYAQGVYRAENLLRRRLPDDVSYSLEQGVRKARRALFEAQDLLRNMTTPGYDRYGAFGYGNERRMIHNFGTQDEL